MPKNASNKRARTDADYRESRELQRLLNVDDGNFHTKAIIDLVQKSPSIASKTHHSGGARSPPGYPIYTALKFRAPLNVIKTLYNAFPDALKMKHNNDRSLLHAACLFGAPLATILFLYEKWSQAIKENENRGSMTALHCYLLCNYKKSLEVISYLVEKWPIATETTDYRGRTPLHCVCSNNPSLDAVAFLIEKYPVAVQMKDCVGKTPLFYACEFGAPLDVVSLLVEKYTLALEVKCNNGTAPIHCVGNRISLDVLVLLLRKTPNAVKIKDVGGRTALHYACQYGMHGPMEKICLLLEKWPEAVEEKDSNGKFPSVGPYFFQRTEEVKVILRDVGCLVRKSVNQSGALEIIKRCIRMNWWGGVSLVFRLFPAVTQKFEDIPANVTTSLLATIGKKCNILTMWTMLRSRQDLLNTNLT